MTTTSFRYDFRMVLLESKKVREIRYARRVYGRKSVPDNIIRS